MEQVQELNRHNKQGHCELSLCQPEGLPCSPLLARVPNLRQGPPNQDGMCSLLTEWPLGCRGSRITSDSRQEDLVHGFHIFLIAVSRGSLETLPQSTVPPSPQLQGGSVCSSLLLALGTRGLLEYPLKASEVGGALWSLCKAWMQSFWGSRRER